MQTERHRVAPAIDTAAQAAIAATSVLFGGVAVAVLWLLRRRRGHGPHHPA